MDVRDDGIAEGKQLEVIQRGRVAPGRAGERSLSLLRAQRKAALV